MSTKKALYFDDARHAQEVRNIDAAIQILQPIVDEVLRLDVIELENMADVEMIAEQGEAYIKEKIVKGIERPKIGRFFVKKKAIAEDLELPDFEALNQLVSNAARELPARASYVCKYITLKNGKLYASPYEVEQLKAVYTIYADTQEKERLLQAANEAANALDTFRKTLKKFGLDFNVNQPLDIYFKQDNEQVVFNSYYYQRHAQSINE